MLVQVRDVWLYLALRRGTKYWLSTMIIHPLGGTVVYTKPLVRNI